MYYLIFIIKYLSRHMKSHQECDLSYIDRLNSPSKSLYSEVFNHKYSKHLHYFSLLLCLIHLFTSLYFLLGLCHNFKKLVYFFPCSGVLLLVFNSHLLKKIKNTMRVCQHFLKVFFIIASCIPLLYSGIIFFCTKLYL